MVQVYRTPRILAASRKPVTTASPPPILACRATTAKLEAAFFRLLAVIEKRNKLHLILQSSVLLCLVHGGRSSRQSMGGSRYSGASGRTERIGYEPATVIFVYVFGPSLQDAQDLGGQETGEDCQPADLSSLSCHYCEARGSLLEVACCDNYNRAHPGGGGTVGGNFQGERLGCRRGSRLL